jgi:hypothetical protein
MEDYIDDLIYMKGFNGNRDQAELHVLIKIYKYYKENYDFNSSSHEREQV